MKEPGQTGPRAALRLSVQKAQEDMSLSFANGPLLFAVLSDDNRVKFEVRLVEKNPAQINFIWAMAQKHNILLPDYVRKDKRTFVNWLLSPNTVIAGVNSFGVLYLTGLRQGDSARMHYFFWDKQQKNRQRLLLMGMLWATKHYNLNRIEIGVPRFATAALYRLYKMGVRLEGVLRKAMMHNERFTDLYVFGVLKEELNMNVVHQGRFYRTSEEQRWYDLFRDDPVLLHKVIRRG